MAKLIFTHLNKTVEIPDNSSIQPACEEEGVPFACSEGICGTCVVKVVEGMENLSSFTEAEKDFFGEMDEDRLACQCKIKKGTVKITF